MAGQIRESTFRRAKSTPRAARNEHDLPNTKSLGDAVNRHRPHAENPDDEHVHFVIDVLVDSSLLQYDEVGVEIRALSRPERAFEGGVSGEFRQVGNWGKMYWTGHVALACLLWPDSL